MTTSTATIFYDITDTTALRATGLAVRNLIVASGITPHTDTGQVNWATVTKPGLNTIIGFEIYRMNDGFTEIYIRLEYWMGAASDRLQFKLNTGTATNGAGVLSNSFTSVILQPAYYAPLTGVEHPCFVCYLPGYFAFSLFEQSAGSRAPNGFVALTRSSDESGIFNSLGYHLIYASIGSPTLQSYTFANDYLHPSSSQYNSIPTNQNATYSGGKIRLHRLYGWTRNYTTQPLPTVLAYLGTDIGKFAQFPCITEGITPKTFLATNVNGGAANWYLAILWQ